MTSKPTKYREFDEPKPDVDNRDPVGALEISARLGLADRTIHMVVRRGQMCEPDYDEVNGSRAWEWSTVLWWAGETDRLRTSDLVRQYRTMFKCTPPVRQGRTPPGVVVHADPTPDIPTLPSMA